MWTVDHWDLPIQKNHTWKECPNNKWGINAGKEVDGDGDIILCTIADLEEVLDDSADATLVERVYEEEGDEILSNDNKKSVKFYFSSKVSTVDSPHEYVFVKEEFKDRLQTLLSQTKGKLNELWVLIDN